MIGLYFNDANVLTENREEEQYAEAALNSILAGKTADTVMCILPCFYDAPLHKGLLYNLDDGTTLQIRPIQMRASRNCSSDALQKADGMARCAEGQ